MELPQRSKRYEGVLTRTEVWDQFNLRADDVLVVTPPKCGTTWTQIIVTSLIAGRPLSPREMGEVSHWIDSIFDPPEREIAFCEALTQRRCIKSHTPFDGIPYDPRCQYFAVYRHPIDVHFSMRVHAARMESDVMRVRYPEDIHEAFRMFLHDELYDGANDALDLHSIVYHFEGFRRWRDLPNVHMFHYADMIADLPGAVRHMARAMGLDDQGALIGEIVDGATFSKLKAAAVAADKASGSGVFYLGANFFNSGTSGKWVDKLTEDDLAEFERRLEVLLPEKGARDWLLWGSRGGGYL
jgi:hypothetical protein